MWVSMAEKFNLRIGGVIEWVCVHKCGHPVWAPDIDREGWGVHGCCQEQCCKDAPTSGWPQEMEEKSRSDKEMEQYIWNKLQRICSGQEK